MSNLRARAALLKVTSNCIRHGQRSFGQYARQRRRRRRGRVNTLRSGMRWAEERESERESVGDERGGGGGKEWKPPPPFRLCTAAAGREVFDLLLSLLKRLFIASLGVLPPSSIPYLPLHCLFHGGPILWLEGARGDNSAFS